MRARGLLRTQPEWGVGALLFLCAFGVSAAQPLPVTQQTVAALTIYPSRSAPGTAVPLNDARISAEVPGTVKALPVQVGDEVEAGQLLAELDCDAHRLGATQAEAQLAVAQAQQDLSDFQLDQMRRMKVGEFASVEMLKQREAGARQAAAEVLRLQAALAAAHRRVSKCEVRAPFAAVVLERTASVGDLAEPGTVLLRLVDRVQLEVSGQVQEQDLAALQEARQVEFVSRNQRYALTLRAVVPVVDSRLRSYEARFSFSEEAASPGQAGRVQWTTSRPHLPPDVLVRRDGSIGVFLADSGRARFHPLPEAREGYPAPIDLEPSAQVVLEGRFGLHDGDLIAPTAR